MNTILTEIPPLIEVRDLVKSFHVGPTRSRPPRRLAGHLAWRVCRRRRPLRQRQVDPAQHDLGVDRLSAGEVLVGGRAIQRLPEAELARWRGTNLGIVFQFFQMLPTMTLLNNVMLPMELAKRYTPAERRARAETYLTVGLQDHLHKLPSRVSGGQQQRAAVARALATTRRSSSATSPPATTAARPRWSSTSLPSWSPAARRC